MYPIIFSTDLNWSQKWPPGPLNRRKSADWRKNPMPECKVSVKLGGGTSNMSAHVRRHHPLLLNKPFGKAKVTSVRNPPGPAPIDSTGADPSASTDSDVDTLTNLRLLTLHQNTKKQMTLGEALKKKETYPPNSNRASDINEKIGRFIVKDLQPFKVVETESFKEVLRNLDPKYNVEKIWNEIHISLKKMICLHGGGHSHGQTSCFKVPTCWPNHLPEKKYEMNSFFSQEDDLVSMLGSRIREIQSLVFFLFDFSFECAWVLLLLLLFVCLFVFGGLLLFPLPAPPF